MNGRSVDTRRRARRRARSQAARRTVAWGSESPAWRSIRRELPGRAARSPAVARGWDARSKAVLAVVGSPPARRRARRCGSSRFSGAGSSGGAEAWEREARGGEAGGGGGGGGLFWGEGLGGGGS